MKKRHLMRSKPEDVLRLARFLGLKRLDAMSHRQRCYLIMWLLKRREKKAAGKAWGV